MSGPSLIPKANQIALAVRFQNNSPDEYKSIVWRAKYGSGYVDFVDDGTFSPQIKIDNFLLFDIGKSHVNILGALLAVRGAGIPIDSEVHLAEYASLSDPENCAIVKTVTADDSAWTSPAFSQQHFVLPAPAPSTEATLAPGEGTPKAPVDIAHCHVLFPLRRNTAQVDTGFRVVSPGKTADNLTFRVSYGRGNFDVEDQGAFSDDTYVRHHLKATLPDELSHRSYFALDDPSNCSVVKIHYTDGTVWENPAAPAAMPVPTPVPDALDNGITEWFVNWKSTLAVPAPTPAATPVP